MAAILITALGGTIDWCTYDADEVQIVFVDLDAATNLDTGFPGDLDKTIKAVAALPLGIRWRSQIIAQLVAARDNTREALWAGDPYGDTEEVTP